MGRNLGKPMFVIVLLLVLSKSDSLLSVERCTSLMSQCHTVSTASALLHHLFRGPIKYDKRDPPFTNQSNLITVRTLINSLYAVHEQTMDYSLSIFLHEKWYEPRLRYDHFKYNISTPINVPQTYWNDLWTPDIFFRNEKTAKFHDITTSNRVFHLFPDGKVEYEAKLSLTLSCNMDLRNYPMDIQICPIMFESFGFTTDVIDFEWQLEQQKNAEEEKAKLSREASELTQYYLLKKLYNNCKQTYTTGTYPCLQISFVLKRNLGFYITQLYLPSTSIVMLSWLSFWIDADIPQARITIGLLTVLTITTQTSSANEALPRVSYVKAIDIWFSACLVFVFTSLLEYSLIHVLKRRHHLFEGSQEGETPAAAARRTRYKKDDGGAIDTNHLTVNHVAKATTSNTHTPDETTGHHRTFNKMGTEIVENVFDRIGYEKIDKLSRVVFPLLFTVFNAVYWIKYLNAQDEPQFNTDTLL